MQPQREPHPFKYNPYLQQGNINNMSHILNKATKYTYKSVYKGKKNIRTEGIIGFFKK